MHFNHQGNAVKLRSTSFAPAALCLGLQLACVPALAQRTGVATGVGLEVCDRVLASIKDAHVQSDYTQWVVGYLSGYNLFGNQKQLEDIPDAAGMDAYLQQYCHDHPFDKVIWAGMALITELGGYRPPYMKK
jgi:hypothetical protein